MKKAGLWIGMLMLLLQSSLTLIAQTTQTKLNQVELAKQFLGTWKENTGKDTIGMWDGNLYGDVVEAHVYMNLNGTIHDSYLTIIAYDKRDGKLKGCNYFPNSDFATWIGVFTTEKMFKVNGLDTFKPDVIWWKAEFEFITPTEAIVRNFNHSGEKTFESTFVKVK